jgi:hypothetical protein
MLDGIKRTLTRLSGKIYGFNPVTWYPLLMEGVAVEFERVRDFKNRILSCTVPHAEMDTCCIDDMNIKYGIPSTLPGTDAEKISRIISKAALQGYPGPQWLQEQIIAAGFPLFVFENVPLDSNIIQFNADGGAKEYAPDPQVQFGLTSRFVDPALIPGYLIVSSAPHGAGAAYTSQFNADGGTVQYTPDGGTVQYGTRDPNALNPQPFRYTRTIDPRYWGFYFVLSPAGGPYSSEADFLPVTQREYDYLVKFILEIKLLRNWCILQVRIV